MSTTVLGIDPGFRRSAGAEWNGERLLHTYLLPNEAFFDVVRNTDAQDVAIERIIPFGRVGKTITETCEVYGGFACLAREVGKNVHYLYRKTIMAHLTGLAKYNDTKIRQCLQARFGPKPSKGAPNPTYGECSVVGDVWQAFAVAVAWFDKHKGGW